MEKELKILGLGFEQASWDALSNKIESDLPTFEISLKFNNLPFTELVSEEIKQPDSHFETKAAEKVKEFAPDLIFSSAVFFNDCERLIRFFKNCKKFIKTAHSGIFIIESDLKGFLADLLQAAPETRGYLNALGEISLFSANNLYFDDHAGISEQIIPAPVFELKNGKQSQDGFIARDKIDTIEWRGNYYQPEKFIRIYARSLKIEDQLPRLNCFLVQDKKVYLSSGMPMVDIIDYNLSDFNIDHILSYQQINKESRGYQLFLKKLEEKIAYFILASYYKRFFNREFAIKEAVPYSVSGDSDILNKIVSYQLLEDGFSNQLTEEKKTPLLKDSCMQIKISEEDIPADQLTYNFMPIFKTILNQDDISSRLEHFNFVPVRLEEPIKLESYQQEISRCQLKVKNINKEKKLNISKNILLEYELKLEIRAGEKLPLLEKLLDKALLWEEIEYNANSRDLGDVLILCDNRDKAGEINYNLHRIEKKIWLDSGGFDKLSQISANLPNRMEKFISSGTVITDYSSYEMLKAAIPELKLKLEQAENKLAELNQSDNYFEEKLQKDLDQAYYQYLWTALYLIYRKKKANLLKVAQRSLISVEKKLFSARNIKKVAVFSLNKDRKDLISQTCQSLFSNLDKLIAQEFSLNLINELPLAEEGRLKKLSGSEEELKAKIAEKISSKNLAKIKNLIDLLKEKVNQEKLDLIIFDFDIFLTNLVLKEIKQFGKEQAYTPTISIISEMVSSEGLNFPASKRVRFAYHSPGRLLSPQSLTKSLSAVLSK